MAAEGGNFDILFEWTRKVGFKSLLTDAYQRWLRPFDRLTTDSYVYVYRRTCSGNFEGDSGERNVANWNFRILFFFFKFRFVQY